MFRNFQIFLYHALKEIYGGKVELVPFHTIKARMGYRVRAALSSELSNR
jgi:hypothetical protein